MADSFRPATREDYPIFSRLFPELGTGDPTPTPDVWWPAFGAHTFFLEREGGPIGYVFLQILDGLGYIRHVIVDPDHRGRGVGRSLMQEAARRVREAGVERWCLNVKPDNEPAVRLYERVGMSLQHASVAMRMGWDIISRLPEPSPDVSTTELLPAADASVELALGLPGGLLVRNRKQPGVRLWVTRRGLQIVGVAVFSPSFPGAYPFAADTIDALRSSLEAMRADADPRFDYVQLVLEGAPTLAKALDDAGAVRHLEFVHFAGPVPILEEE